MDDVLPRIAGLIKSSTKQSHQSAQCPSCAMLLGQLQEANRREQRMAAQLEAKDQQIAMVLQSKFDRPIVQPMDVPEPKTFPLDHLMDVANMSDEAFIEEMKK